MKSIVNDYKVTSNRAYPKLMISTITNQIVLFSSSTRGIAVNDTKYYLSGHLAIDWAISNFVDYQGSVTLSND